jgi:hypothetical protein
MQNEKQKAGMSLYLRLAPQDAEMLRAALSAANVPRSALGIKDTHSLAQMALGAVCRAILGQGYQPQPLASKVWPDGELDQGAPLPSGVMVIKLA